MDANGAVRLVRVVAVAALICALACGCASAVTISGHVRNLEGGGVGGVLIFGGGSLATSTASDGSYSLTVTSGWSGAIGPMNETYQTIPGSYSYTSVTTDQINQDYIATPQQFSFPLSISLYNAAHTASSFNVSRGAIAWGDYDNNGVMDVAIAGSVSTFNSQGQVVRAPAAKIFHSDAVGSGWAEFTEIQTLAAVQDACLAWCDYDNDGKLDIVLAGDTGSSYVTKLYHNNGSSFGEVMSTGLPGVTKGSVAWGDYDNDGRSDLLIAGMSSTGRIARLYRNAGGGTFTQVASLSLPGVSDCAVAWADYDNDGRLDFAIAGNTGSGYIARIYHNDGGGNFSDIGAGLTGVTNASVAWGDYDNDGRLDLAVSGAISSGAPVTTIYHNNGGSFSAISTGIRGVKGQIAWCDYDSDGKPDLAIAGDQGGENTPKIYRNNGGGSFTGILLDTTALTNACLAWGDFDGDGKTDIMVAGDEPYGYAGTFLYKDQMTAANTPPAAPTGLASSFTGSSLTLSWAAATDTQTPQQGLTYNIRMGSSPGAGDVVSGMANYTTGLRRLPALGNVGKNLSWTIQGLTPGTYYWSAQAIDTAYAGSAWAAEKAVTVIAGDTTPPVISSVVCSPTMAAAGETITVTVDASDNVGVTSVTANGSSLAHSTGTLWTGTIAASSALGSNIVSAIAYDAAGNSATASGSYTTARSVALTNRSAGNTIMSTATSNFIFTIWGQVTVIDANSFYLDDFSGTHITVLAANHGLATNDFATARGTLDVTSSPPMLTAHQVIKRN